jgi:hypothetical protein
MEFNNGLFRICECQFDSTAEVMALYLYSNYIKLEHNDAEIADSSIPAIQQFHFLLSTEGGSPTQCRPRGNFSVAPDSGRSPM